MRRHNRRVARCALRAWRALPGAGAAVGDATADELRAATDIAREVFARLLAERAHADVLDDAAWDWRVARLAREFARARRERADSRR